MNLSRYQLFSLISIITKVKCSAGSASTETPLPRIGTPPPEIWPELVVGGKEDPAMGRIEQIHRESGKPYGRFLDAGTGNYSLR